MTSHDGASYRRGLAGESACPTELRNYLMAIVNRLLGVLLITTRTPTADPVGAFMGIWTLSCHKPT